MNKPISAVLCLSLLATVMVSCAEDEIKQPVTEVITEAITQADTEPAGPAVQLPDADYSGETITYVMPTNYNSNFLICMEPDGDSLNDASVERNNRVAEKLNVVIEAIELENAPNVFRKSIMADDHDYDFILPHATEGVAALVTDQLLYDWTDLEYVDMTKPWWNNSMTESLGIGGKLYYASGDMVMTWQGMIAILFNKSYLSGMDLEKDLYQTVFDGEWTLSYLLEIINGVHKDLNGDGKMTEVDQYGLLDDGEGYSFMYAADQRVTVPDSDGVPTLALNTERMYRIVDLFYDISHSEDTYQEGYWTSTYDTSNYRAILTEGRAFLTTFDIGSLYQKLREIDYEFGILPVPKLDEEQDQYRVFCGAGLIGAASNISDPVMISAAAEAMAYESYRLVRPVFFDIVLENKTVRDENSYRVLQLMHENKVFDFGFNFDKTGTAYGMLKAVVVDKKSRDFASHYAKKEKNILKGFTKILEAVEDAD